MLRYASIFVNKHCKLTIDELRRNEYKNIKIPKLMPAFMNIHKTDDMKLALDYITNFCINKRNCKSKTVHNMAFFFHSKINDPVRMIKFLESEEIKKAKGHQIYFEVDYALNICKQKEKELMDEFNNLVQKSTMFSKNPTGNSDDNALKNRYEPQKEQVKEQILVMKKAQIIIYAILNHFDKAVKIALECRDTDMAKQYANKPEDKKLKKKLWMKIAKYLFNYQGKKGKGKQ